ncbi:hypothetical protein N825_16355 [Skermanella stibiiresistens SB22]|uniref:VTT domain-containing protein n=1 Tax=Skermanella stibiiresistens SB22 TaxID=1385369 RepID=W9GYW0_9PROT|nr:VTT domain-containing protein [Skermanella stibiiresistens]EWY37622.1 hypothetical protein N825_16355 [Skermanella stibiiresistens SB22]
MLTPAIDWLGFLVLSMDPWLLVPALVLMTFLLEDVAIAAGVALAIDGTLGWPVAFLAVAGGIALGDLGLYGLGHLAVGVPSLRRRLADGRFDRAKLALEDRLVAAVLVARVVPGLRLATYTAAGFLAVPFARFTALVVVAVAAWTAGLFWLTSALGQALGGALERALGLSPTTAVIVAILALAFLATRLPRVARGFRSTHTLNTGVSP